MPLFWLDSPRFFMQIHVVDSFFCLLEIRSVTIFIQENSGDDDDGDDGDDGDDDDGDTYNMMRKHECGAVHKILLLFLILAPAPSPEPHHLHRAPASCPASSGFAAALLLLLAMITSPSTGTGTWIIKNHGSRWLKKLL